MNNQSDIFENQYQSQGDSFCDAFNAYPLETFELEGSIITRIISSRAGDLFRSSISVPDGYVPTGDLAADYDISWLRSKNKPVPFSLRNGHVRLVDLFSGAGGISLGIEEACRALEMSVEHVLAADTMPEALRAYQANFGVEIPENKPLQEWLDGDLGADITNSERELVSKLGDIDIVVGGPPCQGHSDLNNHTRRNDPKNELFERMGRVAEVIRPKYIIIENVPGVKHDVGGVFRRTLNHIKAQGYHVDSSTLSVDRLGVPQLRQRAIVVASLCKPLGDGFLDDLASRVSVPTRSVGWAINDLMESSHINPIDQVTSVSAISKQRIDWLFDNGEYDLPDYLRPDCHKLKKHSYKSVYGRLYWDKPSWTITTGFQVMGQGRFLHPLKRRVITSHEAARLQFFPDYFDFVADNRKGFAKLIGNAVPSKLSYLIALTLLS